MYYWQVNGHLGPTKNILRVSAGCLLTCNKAAPSLLTRFDLPVSKSLSSKHRTPSTRVKIHSLALFRSFFSPSLSNFPFSFPSREVNSCNGAIKCHNRSKFSYKKTLQLYDFLIFCPRHDVFDRSIYIFILRFFSFFFSLFFLDVITF